MKSLHNFISYPVDYSGGFSLTCSESLDDSTRNANSTAKALNGPVTALDSMGTTDKIALQMCTISCTKDGYLTHVERVDDVLCSHMDRSKHGNENHHRSYDIIICITHWIGMGKKKGGKCKLYLYIHTPLLQQMRTILFSMWLRRNREYPHFCSYGAYCAELPACCALTIVMAHACHVLGLRIACWTTMVYTKCPLANTNSVIMPLTITEDTCRQYPKSELGT